MAVRRRPGAFITTLDRDLSTTGILLSFWAATTVATPFAKDIKGDSFSAKGEIPANLMGPDALKAFKTRHEATEELN